MSPEEEAYYLLANIRSTFVTPVTDKQARQIALLAIDHKMQAYEKFLKDPNVAKAKKEMSRLCEVQEIIFTNNLCTRD